MTSNQNKNYRVTFSRSGDALITSTPTVCLFLPKDQITVFLQSPIQAPKPESIIGLGVCAALMMVASGAKFARQTAPETLSEAADHHAILLRFETPTRIVVLYSSSDEIFACEEFIEEQNAHLIVTPNRYNVCRQIASPVLAEFGHSLAKRQLDQDPNVIDLIAIAEAVRQQLKKGQSL